jgi:hypothetical protein
MPLFLLLSDISTEAHYKMIHYFALRVCELDVDWKLECSVAELMSFVTKNVIVTHL